MKKSVKLRANLIYYACKVVGWLPWWILYYPVAEIIYFLLYYVTRYRVRVTRANLAESFPEKDGKELRRIERKFYRHLSQVFVDTIDLTGISAKGLRKRILFDGEEEFRAGLMGMDFIAATSHYGSWEYFTFYAIGNEPEREILGVYRPLHDEAFDLFYKRMRSRFGTIPVPRNSLLRRIVSNRQKSVPMGIGLIADQTPPRSEIDHWFDFLGRPTPFFMGTEKIACRFGMPVYFLKMEKRYRAHYTVSFEILWDGKEKLQKYELTQRYASMLEEVIRERPECWMWSHRRWKHRPEPGEPETGQERQLISED